MSEICIANAMASVVVYDESARNWFPAVGAHVQILEDTRRPAFRIVAVRPHDRSNLLNCNIFQRIKYAKTAPKFHQWKDENRRNYGLTFQQDHEAESFFAAVMSAIERLRIQSMNGNNENDYHAGDNVYQDPHQHLNHIHSAPNFHHEENNQHANFRNINHQTLSSASTLTQQQRRASQSSSTSAGSSAPPPVPPTSNIPQAPPPPPVSIAPVKSSNAPPPPPLPPVGAGAPPPPPPPPPPAQLMASNGTPSLADQLKMRSQQGLKKTTNGITSNGAVEQEKPAVVAAAPKGGGDLMSELNAQLNKRKMTQAKSDAVDSKSNTSNGSSDSGCGIGTSSNGSNGGSVGSAAAKKWSVSEASKPFDSPKAHRKLPSASSLFDDSTSSKSNGTTSTVVGGASNEQLDRLRADLMVEFRLEINKLRQDMMTMMEANKQEILETILNAIGTRR